MSRNNSNSRYRNTSFHWKGRTKQGVSIWSGSVTPLLVIGRIFSAYGLLAGLGGLGALVYGLMTGSLVHAFPGVLALIGLIHGVVFGGIGQWALRMRRYVQGLAPAGVVRDRFGIDSAGLKRLAQERNIRPRLILNEEPYYDPADLVEAMSLLRAGSAPMRADGLLRAANAGAVSDDSLLHASQSSDDPHRSAAERELDEALKPLNWTPSISSAELQNQPVELKSAVH